MRLIDADALKDKAIDTDYMPTGKWLRLSDLDAAPTVDVPERKVGKWKRDADGLVWCYWCGFGKERSDERPYHYCPNCGAKMEC